MEKQIPESWLDAFYMLEQLLQEKDDGSRQVVFLDELPWLDSPRSGFIRAFEGFKICSLWILKKGTSL